MAPYDNSVITRKNLFYQILFAATFLMGLGAIHVYSTSFFFSLETRGDGWFFFLRHVRSILLGVAVMFFTAYVLPLDFYRRLSMVSWLGVTVLVALTLMDGFGVAAGGASRWLNLPFLPIFEPSEVLKLAFVGFMAFIIADHSRRGSHWDLTFLLRAIMVLAPLALLLMQPDFGAVVICLSVGLIMLFAMGLKWTFIIPGIAVFSGSFYYLVYSQPYRLARLQAFFDPWSDPMDKGFQVIQSMLSVQSGGLFGVGPGLSQAKLFFLPEAHTDFTLSVFIEEYGLIGFIIVLALYLVIIHAALRLVELQKDTFLKALSVGLATLFALSVLLNMMVALGLAPTKGMVLPFLSYGGTALVMNCFLIGLMLRLSRHDPKIA